MKTVNSLSGGKTSSYMAVKYPADYEVFSLVCIDDVKCAPKDKGIKYYIDAKLEKFADKYGEFVATAEDDATILAMYDLEQFLGREIIWVRGKSFGDVISSPSEVGRGGKPTRLPSWARRYCTMEMKLIPIFEWWFRNIGEKVNMRIGFRYDEYDRMERFLNNTQATMFKYPISCSTRGQRLQKFENFNWRFCHFPLIKDGIRNNDVIDFWRNKHIPASLFEPERKIEFPVISNCIGCFHKKPDTLSIMAAQHPEKFKWFAEQEEKGMGTWLDSKITYKQILESSENWIPEMLKETGASCDSGGCTD